MLSVRLCAESTFQSRNLGVAQWPDVLPHIRKLPLFGSAIVPLVPDITLLVRYNTYLMLFSETVDTNALEFPRSGVITSGQGRNEWFQPYSVDTGSTYVTSHNIEEGVYAGHGGKRKQGLQRTAFMPEVLNCLKQCKNNRRLATTGSRVLPPPRGKIHFGIALRGTGT